MRVRKLTATGDYSWGSSSFDFYINSPAGVGQVVKTRLLLWLGEWFLNTNLGTPYMTGIIGKHSKTTADTVVQDVVDNTQDSQGNDLVVDISEFQSSVDNRNYSVNNLTINTVFGPTQVQIQNYVNY